MKCYEGKDEDGWRVWWRIRLKNTRTLSSSALLSWCLSGGRELDMFDARCSTTWTTIDMEAKYRSGLFMMNHIMFRSTNNAGCILSLSHAWITNEAKFYHHVFYVVYVLIPYAYCTPTVFRLQNRTWSSVNLTGSNIRWIVFSCRNPIGKGGTYAGIPTNHVTACWSTTGTTRLLHMDIFQSYVCPFKMTRCTSSVPEIIEQPLVFRFLCQILAVLLKCRFIPYKQMLQMKLSKLILFLRFLCEISSRFISIHGVLG